MYFKEMMDVPAEMLFKVGDLIQVTYPELLQLQLKGLLQKNCRYQYCVSEGAASGEVPKHRQGAGVCLHPAEPRHVGGVALPLQHLQGTEKPSHPPQGHAHVHQKGSVIIYNWFS